MQRILALDAWRLDYGRGDKELSKALRAYARAMSVLMGPAIMMAALEPERAWRRDVAWDRAIPEHPFGGGVLVAAATGARDSVGDSWRT